MLEGIDYPWIAKDVADQLAIFFNASIGPLPRIGVEYQEKYTDDIQYLVEDLPAVSEYILLSDVPRPDDFIEIARRGFYCFDWSDIHETESGKTGLYHLVSYPILPKRAWELNGNIGEITQSCPVSSIIFDKSNLTIDINYMR